MLLKRAALITDRQSFTLLKSTNVANIEKIGDVTKYNNGGQFLYLFPSCNLSVNNNILDFRFYNLHRQRVAFEEIQDNFSTANAEQLADYYAANGFFSVGSAGVTNVAITGQPISVDATYADSFNIDAFGRLRTSDTGQRLDVEFRYDKQTPFFDEITTNGTVTFNGNTRDLTLSLADAVDSSRAIMSSYPVHYTPGNSQLIDATGVLNLSNLAGGTVEVFLRSSITGTVTEQTITQASWLNLTSGVDWSFSHIFTMDFQSLKVGRIRYFLIQDGLPIQVAEINNDNVRDSGFWQLPDLPPSYRLYNTATETIAEIGYCNDENGIGFRFRVPSNATATMKAICCTVKSEGGQNLSDIAGIPRTIDIGTTTKTVSNTIIPLLSIRPKSTFKGFDNLTTILPKSISISTNNSIKLVVLHQGTLTGASWVDVDANQSTVEYDISATAIANGHSMFSDYIETTSKNAGTSEQGFLGKTVLWNRKGTQTGVITIAAIRTTNSNADVLASIIWEEIR